MAKSTEYEWKFTIYDVEHIIKVTTKGRWRYSIDDGDQQFITFDFFSNDKDFLIDFEGHPIYIVIRGGIISKEVKGIAVDGKLLETGAVFTPMLERQKLFYVFFLLCMSPTFTFGFIGAIIGIIGVSFCDTISRSRKISLLKKVLCCFGVVLMVWVIAFLFMVI